MDLDFILPNVSIASLNPEFYFIWEPVVQRPKDGDNESGESDGGKEKVGGLGHY
jgi:hypothetical protein